MERLLIQKSDFAGYRTLSSKIDQATQLDPYILEAQRLDLMPLLGNALYFKLLTVMNAHHLNLNAFVPSEETPAYVPTDEEQHYLNLLNGVTYTHDDITREYLGIKPVLVYLTFARFVRSAHINSTESGFRKLVNQYSEPATRQEINDLATSATNDAQAFMASVRDFTRHHASIYDLGHNDTCSSERPSDRLRTRLTPVRKSRPYGRNINR